MAILRYSADRFEPDTMIHYTNWVQEIVYIYCICNASFPFCHWPHMHLELS